MELSAKSQHLIRFFSNQPSEHYVSHTKKTDQLFKHLYNDIYQAYKYVETMTFNATIKRRKNATDITKPIVFNASHFPKQIYEHIEKNTVGEIIYSFSLFERTVNVYFIVEESNIEKDMETYNRYIKSIATWLYIVHMHASKKCVKTLSIYIYLTSLQKQLPTSNTQVLDAIHVNTAFTTTCPVISEIVIFRKEEWFKVFIHETFHNFGLDFSDMNCDSVNQCILSIFDVNITDLRPYEAYTEFWANILNVLFCSFFKLKKKENVAEFLENSEFYLTQEITHSLFQMVKTLQFMGLYYKDLYSKKNEAKFLRENLYKEKTNVFSYFILKTILLYNYPKFVAWCDTQHPTSIFHFHKTPQSLQSFCRFIQQHYKTQSMTKSVDEMQDLLYTVYSSNTKHSMKKEVIHNMRMTVCELG